MQTNIAELIKEKLDIVSVIEKYVELKPAGKNFVARCPFHNEKTPSFNVSPDIQIFKCFGCGKSGDIITFIQEIEKVDFIEAVEKLAPMAGIVIEKEKRELHYIERLNNLACRFYMSQLKKYDIPLKYLHGRGFSDTDIEKYKIGYSPKDNGLLKLVRSRYKFSNDQLISSGLFILKENQLRDKFKDRVVFPIFSSGNRLIAFNGRILPGNDYGPKYLHSPETEIFHKKETVYGLNIAKNDIRKKDLCIICEGATDVISANKNEILNIVAPLGTSLTKEQLQSVSQYTKNILFIFDSDKAGQLAVERALFIANTLNLNTYATNTAPYKDIDELIQKEPKGLDSRIEGMIETFSYLLANRIKDLNINEYKDFSALKTYINHLLTSTTDINLRNFYISKVKEITGLEHSNQYSNRDNDLKTKRSTKPTLEQTYLVTLLQTQKTVPENLDITVFTDEKVALVLKEILKAKEIDTKKLHEKPEIKEVIEGLLFTSSTSLDSNLESVYKRIVDNHLRELYKKCRTDLASAEALNDTEAIKKLTNELISLTDKLKNIG